MEERTTITVRGKEMHLIVGVDPSTIEKDDELWDFSFDDFLVGAVEVNEDYWYVYSNGRCYETFECVN